MSVGVGDQAPEFSLEGTGDETYSLESYLGSPVVLAFYPEDFSPVCSAQLRAYSNASADFASLDAVVLGLSPQRVSTHDSFAERNGINFPLLADVDKQVGAIYGVLGPLGFYRRSVFVIDRDGVLCYVHRARAGLTFRSSSELLGVLRELK